MRIKKNLRVNRKKKKTKENTQPTMEGRKIIRKEKFCVFLLDLGRMGQKDPKRHRRFSLKVEKSKAPPREFEEKRKKRR